MSDWEPRRPNEQTASYLGRVLDDYLGLADMARRAREGHFDDYFAPSGVADGMEIMRLVRELTGKAQVVPKSERARVLAVRDAAMNGEFDGTKAESDRWAASKEGQDTFRELLGGDPHDPREDGESG